MLSIKELKTEIKASYAFIEKTYNFTRRFIGWETVMLTFNIVNTLTIGLIGVAAGKPELVLYLIVGGLLWSFLSMIFHGIAETMAFEQWEGTLEYTIMSPVRRVTHLGGLCFSMLIYGVVRTAIILVLVSAFLHVSLQNANLFSALVILALSCMPIVGLGLIAAVLPIFSPEKGVQAGQILQAAILLVSGVYYEVSVLPAWLQPLSKISPATYTLQAMRKALLQGAPLSQLKEYIIVLLIMGLILVPLGYFGFLFAERHAKRAGKLSRSG